MDPWTSEQRNKFIADAQKSDKKHGWSGPYHFSVFPRNEGRKANASDLEDSRKQNVTNAIAKTIFNDNPKFRLISLKFYELLGMKIRQHQYLYFYVNEIAMLMKGSTAYAFLLNNKYPEDFPFSDTDIVLYINPMCPPDTFNKIKENLTILVVQTISQYKRTLDHMLFLENKMSNTIEHFLTSQEVCEFKEAFMKNITAISSEHVFSSPFENDAVRNTCSRNSFMIIDSVEQDNSVVKVEVPHYDKCERIPLRKTPIFSSYNSTISFSRIVKDEVDNNGDFDLHRLRWNCLSITKKGLDDEVKEERIPADFIDISIPSQNDSELLDFWHHGNYTRYLEKSVGIWIDLPDLETCVNDLHKMLYVYDCPEHKRMKRIERYEKLKAIVKNGTEPTHSNNY